MPAPVVLFCTGATKAGTSWLHRYLSDHPECHMRPIKELHYFDALDFDQAERQSAEVSRVRDRVLAKVDGARPEKVAKYLHQIAAYEHYLELMAEGRENIPSYLKYLTDEREDQRLVADMTPAYSLLSAERLKMMGAITPNVRMLYVLRDPVSRLWSHIRMMATRRASDGVLRRALADQIFERVLAGQEPQITMRGDYARAIPKLRAAVDPSRFLLAVYEDMVGGQALPQICAFLGLTAMPPKTAKPVNAGQPLAMLPEQHAAARAYLAEQYDYVHGLLGRLPVRWDTEILEGVR